MQIVCGCGIGKWHRATMPVEVLLLPLMMMVAVAFHNAMAELSWKDRNRIEEGSTIADNYLFFSLSFFIVFPVFSHFIFFIFVLFVFWSVASLFVYFSRFLFPIYFVYSSFAAKSLFFFLFLSMNAEFIYFRQEITKCSYFLWWFAYFLRFFRFFPSF